MEDPRAERERRQHLRLAEDLQRIASERRTIRGMIRYGDIDVPRADIAELAIRLRDAGKPLLAEQFGIAIDENRESFTIPPDDYETVISLLAHDPIPGLEPLRIALLNEIGRPNRLAAETD